MSVLRAPLLHLPLELLLGNPTKVVWLLLKVDRTIPLLLLLSHHLLLLLHHRIALLLLHHLLLLLLLLHWLALHLALLHLLGNPALGTLHLLLDTCWQDRNGVGAPCPAATPVVRSLLYEGSHQTWVGFEYLEDLLLLLWGLRGLQGMYQLLQGLHRLPLSLTLALTWHIGLTRGSGTWHPLHWSLHTSSLHLVMLLLHNHALLLVLKQFNYRENQTM